MDEYDKIWIQWLELDFDDPKGESIMQEILDLQVTMDTSSVGINWIEKGVDILDKVNSDTRYDPGLYRGPMHPDAVDYNRKRESYKPKFGTIYFDTDTGKIRPFRYEQDRFCE